MRKYVKYILGSLLIGSVALAVADYRVDKITSAFAQWFQSGFYVGTAAINPPRSTTNKVTKMLATDYSPWDYPALAIGALNSVNQSYAETDPVTLTGAAIGDQCDVVSNFGLDGGSALPLNADLSCIAGTNTVTGRLAIRYNMDAGTLNLTDAGYRYFIRR